MFTLAELMRLRTIPNATVKPNFQPEQLDINAVWEFHNGACTNTYLDAIKAKHAQPLLHVLIMHETVEFISGECSIMVFLPTKPQTEKMVFPIVNLPIPEIHMVQVQLAHICNTGMALKHNGILNRIPEKPCKVKPCGKRKPKATVNSSGEIYNVTYHFNSDSCFKRKQTYSDFAAKTITCHDRILSEMPMVAERYVLLKNDNGTVEKGIKQQAKICSHCDTIRIVETDIKITMETMGMFPELVDAFEALTN